MIAKVVRVTIAPALLFFFVITSTSATCLQSVVPVARRVAVLPLGDVGGLRGEVARVLTGVGVSVVPDGLSDSAARGVGFNGSLNPTTDEVRRLAAAIGSEFLVMGTSSLVERESANSNRRWDGFAALFLVDGRSGALLRYRGLQIYGSDKRTVECQLFAASALEVETWRDLLSPADQQSAILGSRPSDAPMLDFVGQPEGSRELIPPRFFKRPIPAYTPDADRVHASATVELLVEFLESGAYGRIEVVRWAGFGLEESAISAIRGSTFWPARRNGIVQPARALLRFNFTFRSDVPLTRPDSGYVSAPAQQANRDVPDETVARVSI